MTKSYGKIYQNKSNVSIIPFDIYNLYPVGSIYMSVNSTNPSVYFGGTWEQFAKGRCLMGAGVVEANTDNWCGTTNAGDWTAYAGLMGGEVWHYLNISEMPSHTHGFYGALTGVDLPITNYGNEWSPTTTSWKKEDAIAPTGGNQAHNNMPPYIVVYIWKRVA